MLEAGADPFSATLNAIGREDELTFKLTLPKCQMFSESLWLQGGLSKDYSVLSYALCRGPSRTIIHIIHLIVQRLARDRRQLADLVRQTLPCRQLHRLGLYRKETDEIPLQVNADLVVKALLQKGVEIPALILPCPGCTIYHVDRMTVEVADILWAQGFRCIDPYDAWGCTPLLLACSHWWWAKGMVCCFLDKWASPLRYEGLGIESCLHALAAMTAASPFLSYDDEAIKRLSLLCSPLSETPALVTVPQMNVCPSTCS